MGHAEEALKLFLTSNIVEAQNITRTLEKYNQERQNIEKKIFNEANALIENEDANSIVLGHENWHHGVIGIVSSKLTEMYYKPSILVCFEGEEAKGSGRSILGFDLYNALSQTNKYLEKYGGHEMAVGLTLKRSEFDNFKKAFQELVDKSNVSDIVPIINIDYQLSSKEIAKETVKQLQLLEPFGEANKMPILLFKNLKISSIRALSEGKHLKLTLNNENQYIDAIGFNMGNLSEEYQLGDKVDIVGMLEINEFNQNEYLQINMKDIMKTY